MVCCLYVGICFGVVRHHMPDQVVTLAWHTRPHKIRSQIHELTCEACHVHNRRGFGANADKPGRSTLDTKKGYKTKTGSTSSVTPSLTLIKTECWDRAGGGGGGGNISYDP